MAVAFSLALVAWALILASGLPMMIFYHIYQLLDVDLLRDRLGESLLYLHGQPPLLNLQLGLALKLERAIGLPHERLLWLGQMAFAVAGLAGLAALSARMLPRRRVLGTLVLALVVFHPVIWIYIHFFFYLIHELALLVGIAFYAGRWLDHRRTRDHVMFCLCVLLLCYFRSLFHFVWALPLLWLAPLLNRPTRRRDLVVSLAAMMLLLAWPAKNWLLLGSFTSSTWGGSSLARGLESLRLMDAWPDSYGLYRFEAWDGEPVRWSTAAAEIGFVREPDPLRVRYWVGHPHLAASGAAPVRVRMRLDSGPWTEAVHTAQGLFEMQLSAACPHAAGPLRLEIEVDPPWEAADGRQLGIGFYIPDWLGPQGPAPAYQVELAHVHASIPEHLRHIPALTLVQKFPYIDNFGNWNHYSYIENNRRQMRLSTTSLRENPRLILRKLSTFYLYTTIFSSIHPYIATLTPADEYKAYPLLVNWLKLYRSCINLEFFPLELLLSDRPRQIYRTPSGFMLLFPLMVLAPALVAWRRRRTEPRQAALALLMLYAIWWLLAMVLLVDGYEGARMRLPVMPLLYLLTAWSLPRGRSRSACANPAGAIFWKKSH